MYLNIYTPVQNYFRIQDFIKKSLYLIIILQLFVPNVYSEIISEEWDNHTISWLLSMQNEDGGFGYNLLSTGELQPNELTTYHAVGILYMLNATHLESESCAQWLELKFNERYNENHSDIFLDYIDIDTTKKLNPYEKIGIDLNKWMDKYQCDEGYFLSDCNQTTPDINAQVSETRDAVCLLDLFNQSISLNKTIGWLISVTPKNNSFDSLGMCSFLIDSYKCIGLNMSSQVNTTEVIDWVLSRQNNDGSFGDGSPDDTYFAMNILSSFNCTNERCLIAINNAIYLFMSLQNSDGGFYTAGWNFNKSDIDSTYIAVNALNLFGATPKNTTKCISWVLSHENQNTKCFIPEYTAVSTPQTTYFIGEFLNRVEMQPINREEYYNWLRLQPIICSEPTGLADASYIILMLNNAELENRLLEIQSCIGDINKNIDQFTYEDIYHASIILNITKNHVQPYIFDICRYNLKDRMIMLHINHFWDTYYCAMAKNYLGFYINDSDKQDYLKYINAIRNHDGGFGSMNYSNMMETNAAIRLLHILKEPQIDVNKTISWILSCKKEKGFSMANGTGEDLFHSSDPVATSIAISSFDILSDSLEDNGDHGYEKDSMIPVLMVSFLIIFVILALFLIRRNTTKNSFIFGLILGIVMGMVTIFIAPITAFLAFSIESVQLTTTAAGHLFTISVILFLGLILYSFLKKYMSLVKGMILGCALIFMITPLLFFMNSI